MNFIIVIIPAYIWYENTKTLEHITYLGGEGSVWGASLWVAVTDDFKYLMQDYGTAPPPRGVIVWRLEDGEVVFSGIYYDDINLRGHSIEIIKYYDEYYAGKWLNRDIQLSEEEILFAQNYLESNKPPEELKRTADLAEGNGFALIIVYGYNLDTKERKIIGGQYIRTM